MIEQKLSRKITVLFSKNTDQKLNEICHKMDRSKSNLIRLVVSEWMGKIMKG